MKIDLPPGEDLALPPLPDQTLLGTELSGHVLECYGHTDETLQVYAAAAVLAERERCAKLCEERAEGILREGKGCRDGRYDWMADGAGECAAAIRASR